MALKFSQLFIAFTLLIAAFLYTYNLHQTYPFDGDTARDTYRMLEIWRNKEITLIGAPLSLGYGSTKEVYFSSLPNYIGLLGLIVARFNPIGATIPNIIIFLISIPIFFIWVRKISTNTTVVYLATMIYAWSPLTVNQARFFWNPNLIIPLSVLFWYLTSVQAIFLAGLVIGIMFNLHYLGIIGGVAYGIYLLSLKHWSKLLHLVSGVIIGIIPTIIFELRNQFYLSKTLWWNLVHSSGSIIGGDRPSIVEGLARSILVQFGVVYGDLAYPILYNFSTPLILGISIITIILLTLIGISLWRKQPQVRPLIGIFFASVLLINVAGASGYTRYLWSVLPIGTWLVSESLVILKPKRIYILMLLFIVFSSLVNVTTPRVLTDKAIPLSDLEKISKTILQDNPIGRFNVTESITGDARFVAVRYFLLRDALNNSQDQTSYTNLDALYVAATNDSEPLEGDRWEFTATPNLKLVKTWDTGELTVAKYERK